MSLASPRMPSARCSSAMSPKRYLGIERFRDAITGLAEVSSLSDPALDARYADQSHMAREVTRFAAMSPGRLRASDRPYARHVRSRRR